MKGSASSCFQRLLSARQRGSQQRCKQVGVQPRVFLTCSLTPVLQPPRGLPKQGLSTFSRRKLGKGMAKPQGTWLGCGSVILGTRPGVCSVFHPLELRGGPPAQHAALLGARCGCPQAGDLPACPAARLILRVSWGTTCAETPLCLRRPVCHFLREPKNLHAGWRHHQCL